MHWRKSLEEWECFNMPKTKHKSVLLNEAIDGLNLKLGDVFVDATLGGAGHSIEVCKRFGKDILILGIDRDKDALDRSRKILEEMNCNFKLFESNFSDIEKVVTKSGIKEVDAVLFDFGLSSDQLDVSGRGFSFMRDESLIMTMSIDKEALTARDIVNSWSEENLATIIYGYGEEQFSRKIAKNIVEARKVKPIETTFELVEIISKSVPNFYRKGRVHFATKTFQALRIAVNDELESIKRGLENGFQILKSGGRISAISFHSLEDRIVKRFFEEKKKVELGRSIFKKPITASPEELLNNPRSRSAKLRVFEKQ